MTPPFVTAEVFGSSGFRRTPRRQHLSDLLSAEILIRYVIEDRLEDFVHSPVGVKHRHVGIQILAPVEMGEAVHILGSGNLPW